MFISFEGIDGSGKTTQAALLAERLGDEAVALREPGGAQGSERIREILVDDSVPLDPLAELLLFCSARAQLVAEVIRPAMSEGRDVVCDRFSDSTVAYQGAARGLGEERTREACDLASGGLWPDLTLFLRIDPELAAGRADGDDRFESEGIEFQRAVADCYERIAAAEPGRVKVIDASGDTEQVAEAVASAIEEAR